MPRGMYEYFEHTADVGLRVRATTLDELFADAARGMFALMIDADEPTQAGQPVSFRLAADRLDDLLHDWLSELLFTFEARQLVLGRFDVHITDTTLEAQACSEPLDPARHTPGTEIKAVTYHGLSVQRDADGYVAEVIVDT